jgi:CubicO group peptidase (beta-lactamase class C family)
MAITRRDALLAGGACALAPIRALAASPPLTQEGLAELRRKAGSPALAAAAQQGGGPVRLWVDGERAAGSGVAVTPEDLWHLGSITKSMTATLAARLVEKGALSWDDTVGDVLGATAPVMRDAYRDVTLRHLLSHRSGLPHNISVLDYLRYEARNPDPRAERRDYARRALAMRPEGPKEATFNYSNNGYVVAGAMIEARLGRPWEDLLQGEVFRPLGMTSAGFGPPGADGRLDQPVGHMKALLGDERVSKAPDKSGADNPAVLGPAGTVHCSLVDALRYLTAHQTRSDFLTKASWAALHTPPYGGDYALGWYKRPGGQFVHGGWNRRWMAIAVFSPESNLRAFAVTNDGYARLSDPEVVEAVQRAANAVRDP